MDPGAALALIAFFTGTKTTTGPTPPAPYKPPPAPPSGPPQEPPPYHVPPGPPAPGGATGPAQPPPGTPGPTGPAQPPPGQPGPTGAPPPTWPAQPPRAITALKFPDDWHAHPNPIPAAVVSRAKQLLASGLRWSSVPQTAPDTVRKLEFVAGEWVMFVPGTFTGNDMNVFAWVPKVDIPEEHQAPS